MRLINLPKIWNWQQWFLPWRFGGTTFMGKYAKFEISTYLKRIESKTKKMVRIDQKLWSGYWYHPEKANIMIDALNQKSSATLAHIHTIYVKLLLNLKTLGITLYCNYNGALVADVSKLQVHNFIK